LLTPEEVATESKEPGAGGDALDKAWEETQSDPYMSEWERLKFIPAEDAPRAPRLKVADVKGKTQTLRPGNEGEITIVLFWSLDVPMPAKAPENILEWVARSPMNSPPTAAAKHVRDLVAKYGGMGVRAVGIVEKTYAPDDRGKRSPTDSYRLAPTFITSKRINYPDYYDDGPALTTMIKEADLKVTGNLPWIFILDRKQRIRFAKEGFGYVSGRFDQYGASEEYILDNAVPGKRVEDYLALLLKE
jgi:hypothetical protein